VRKKTYGGAWTWAWEGRANGASAHLGFFSLPVLCMEAIADFRGVSILPISSAVRENRDGFSAFSKDRNAAL
jgi:hypothetical protein